LEEGAGAAEDVGCGYIERAGDRPDPGVLFARLRPKLAEGREHIRQALARARRVLTPDQWAKLPDALKAPGGRGPGPNYWCSRPCRAFGA
jgi:hypothetical protein